MYMAVTGPCDIKSRDVKVPGLDPPYPKADDQGSNGEQSLRYPPEKSMS